MVTRHSTIVISLEAKREALLQQIEQEEKEIIDGIEC